MNICLSLQHDLNIKYDCKDIVIVHYFQCR